jgi:hypothetical protein
MRQPYYDFEVAKIVAWCRKHGYTCHVTLKGEVTLRKKRKRIDDTRSAPSPERAQ